MEPRRESGSGRTAAERQLASAAPVRQFVDREEFIAPVQSALKEPQRAKPLVLVYYGGPGIGKSRLRRELVRQMADDPDVVTAVLDFAIPNYRQPETALFALRRTLGEAYHVRFPSFDVAYAVLWQKTHPDTAIAVSGSPKSEFRTTNEATDLGLEQGSLIAQLLDESGKVPLIGLVPKITKLVAAPLEPQNPRTLDPFLSDWWAERGERELEDLPQMEPAAIVGCLPKLWAADVKDFLGTSSRKPQASSRESDGSPESRVQSPEAGLRRAVLFIDTYEGLWGTGDSRQVTVDSRQETDEWVRELVKQLPEALWVICGRQKLRWEEVEADWGTSLSQHQLGALPDKSARRFLESCDITNGQIQDAIVKGSQGVPHYLDLAVDAMQSAKCRVQNAEFRGGSPEELVEQFTRQLDKPEVETLQVLSATRYWYYGLFEHLITQYQTGYPLNGYDDLSRFLFVKEGAAPGTRTMHELMREALQEEQSPELRKRVHLFLHEYYAKQLEGLDVKGITDQHRVALTEALYHGRHGKSAEELWPWFKAASVPLDRAGQYRLLIPLVREVVQALETELGPDHLEVADALFALGTEFHEQGEYDEAEKLYRRALAIAERGLGPEHPFICDCLVWLAKLLRNRGRYDEAEVLCRRALGTFVKPGNDTLRQWDALGNLAAVLIEADKYAEGEEFARRALAVSEKELGPDHSHTANDLNTLAVLFMMQRRYVEAEPFFRRALASKEKTLGTSHPVVACYTDNLGTVLQCLTRYTEAESLHRRALRLCEETCGPDHPDTAIAMNHLGTVLGKQGRYGEAEPLLRQAWAVNERKMGPDHPNTNTIAGNLISVLIRHGSYAEAEPMVLNAIAAREKKLGPEHPQTAAVLHWAGVMYRDEGRHAEAESHLRQALDIRTSALGPEHPETLDSMDALALLEERRGRYAEAESLCRDVLERRERILGPERPEVASTANLLAGICCRDGRNAEAETLYCRALAIREKVFGPDHTFVAEPLEGLAKVYEHTGRAAEAQELSARAQRIRAQAAGE